MANKKSLDAKAYINGEINDKREQFHKASDEEARKQLVENFRETTSSDEYQENLKVVLEDSDTVRKNAKRKKGGDVTSEEFKDAKTEFYGKNMNLDFGEDFEKLDLGKKVDYIFEKFGDTDYAADLIVNLLQQLKSDLSKEMSYGDRKKYTKRIIENLFGGELKNNVVKHFSEKYGRGPVILKILISAPNFMSNYYEESRRANDIYYELRDDLFYNKYENITVNTLKQYINGGALGNELVYYLMPSYEGVLSDREILDFFIKRKHYNEPFMDHVGFFEKDYFKKRLNSVDRKYLIDGIIGESKSISPFFKWDETEKSLVLDDNIDLGKGEDVLSYIIKSMVTHCTDYTIGRFCNNLRAYSSRYHKQIANLLISYGKSNVVRANIFAFLVSKEDKEKILDIIEKNESI